MTPSHRNSFLAIGTGQTLELIAADGGPPVGHLWEQEVIDALVLAFAARRPLLVRGEAGSGKSQIARAAAKVIDEASEPLVTVIHARFEAMDLLYQLDSVARLADAQAGKLAKNNEPYIRKGMLWKAFDQLGKGQMPVLLIDEIDKADADVPNALLDVLGNRSFSVPPLDNRHVKAPGGQLPLIIITTNEERELPPAFVRRCVVLNLDPPAGDDRAFIRWMVERGSVHKRLTIDPSVRELAAEQVLADRKAAERAGFPPVGLAEYIDLLSAVHELTCTLAADAQAGEQRRWLARLSQYALVKNAKQDQRRKPVDEPTPAPST